MNKSYFRNVINESYVQPKVLKEDSEERAWEYRQIQDAAKKAKAMMKKGQKVNFSQLADDFGVSAKDIKKACNESYILGEDETSARPSRPLASNFDPKSYILLDRGMGMRKAEYMDNAAEVKEFIRYAKKFSSPMGVNVWEDSDGYILIKVK